MNRTLLKTLGTAILIFGVPVIHAASEKPSVSTPVTDLKYIPTGVKDASGLELQVAPAYGDLAHGAHGTFVKMPAGFVSVPHTHTEDYYAVVVSGVGSNEKVGAADVPLPVGSYWFQKGGEPHVTKCISPNECIFFLSQPGKFDYVPVAKK